MPRPSSAWPLTTSTTSSSHSSATQPSISLAAALARSPPDSGPPDNSAARVSRSLRDAPGPAPARPDLAAFHLSHMTAPRPALTGESTRPSQGTPGRPRPVPAPRCRIGSRVVNPLKPGETPRAPWIVGVSGASGTPYAAAVLRGLLDAGESVDLVVSAGPPGSRCSTRPGSPSATPTGRTTCGNGWPGAPTASPTPSTWTSAAYGTGAPGIWRPGRPPGRTPTKGMLIVPASTACVAGVALGLSKDLLQRAASVTLKERRAAGRRRAGDPAERADAAAPGDPGRRGRERAAGLARRSTRARRTSRTWWTSSPGGCWTRRACRTSCTAAGRASSAVGPDRLGTSRTDDD